MTGAQPRVRGNGFRLQGFTVPTDCALSLQPRLCGGTWARQGFARCARRERGLDPPGVLFGAAITGATPWCVRCIPLRPRSAWIPARGERLACPRVFKVGDAGAAEVQPPPGPEIRSHAAISGGKRFPVHLGPSRPERSVHSARRSRARAGACREEESLLVRPRKRGVDCEQFASVQGLTHGCP